MMPKRKAISIELKLKHAAASAGSNDGDTFTGWECSAILRAIEVLRRVSENDCTNAQREAADILRQLGVDDV